MTGNKTRGWITKERMFEPHIQHCVSQYLVWPIKLWKQRKPNKIIPLMSNKLSS